MKTIEINGKRYKLNPLGNSRMKQKKTGTRVFVPSLGTVFVQVYEDTPESIALQKAKKQQHALAEAAGSDLRSDSLIKLLMKSNERLEKRLEELENSVTSPSPSSGGRGGPETPPTPPSPAPSH